MTADPVGGRATRATHPAPKPGRRLLRRRRTTRPLAASPVTGEPSVQVQVTFSGRTRYADARALLATARELAVRAGHLAIKVSPPVGEDQPAADPPTVVTVHPGPRTVLRGDEELTLSRLEFDLLLYLAEHPRQVFTRQQLLNNVWGLYEGGERTVDVHVRRLRAKVLENLVTTVRGVGYRLTDDAPITVARQPAAPGVRNPTPHKDGA